ncbi:unnamed protein product [Nesidiocoris tenuis]|uniref:Ig-like domain-containing protein n=1 Tax=Nesidiocoris tenuis TaxID=355587 RepID=A0A6H5HI58_9HEMI|nr:unnamed protein product [Nesidiocoris tenuis]
MEPPPRLEFSNSSGGRLDCTASGLPQPTVSWQGLDGSNVGDVPGVRRVLSNGTLLLLAFPPELYRQDVHSNVYRCTAANNVGSIISRDVHVRAGIYEDSRLAIALRVRHYQALSKTSSLLRRMKNAHCLLKLWCCCSCYSGCC